MAERNAKLQYDRVWHWYYTRDTVIERLLQIWKRASYRSVQKRNRTRSKVVFFPH